MGQRWINLAGITAMSALALAVGCGSDDSGTKATGTGGAAGSGGAADAGGDAPTGESLTVFIGEGSYFVGPCDATKNKPIAGAAVAVDLPGGTRVELESGADGSVKVDGVDWSKGRLGLTFWAADRTVASVTGLDKTFATSLLDGGKLVFCLPPRLPPSSFNLSGNAKSMASTSNTYIASASASADVQVVNGTQKYLLRVWPDKPVSVFGAESLLSIKNRAVDQTLSGWTRVDHAALTADATIDLDFATKLTPTKVSGKLMLPKDPASVLRTDSFGYLNVATVEGGWGAPFIGATTTAAPNAAGDAIEHQSEYLPLTDIGTVVTLYSLRVQGGPQSIVWKVGPPENNATIDGFLDTFSVVQPSGGGPLHGDIELASPDIATAGVVQGVQLMSANSELVWFAIDCDSTSTKLRLPELPTKVPAADVIGSLELTAVPFVSADYDIAQDTFLRQVNVPTAAFKLQP